MVILYLILPLVFYSLVTGSYRTDPAVTGGDVHSAGGCGYVSGTLLLAIPVPIRPGGE